MSDKIWARNTVTGKVVQIPARHLGHPVLGRNYVEADRKDKDYLPELYSPKSADEFEQSKKSRKKPEPEEAVEVPEIIIDTHYEGGELNG